MTLLKVCYGNETILSHEFQIDILVKPVLRDYRIKKNIGSNTKSINIEIKLKSVLSLSKLFSTSSTLGLIVCLG